MSVEVPEGECKEQKILEKYKKTHWCLLRNNGGQLTMDDISKVLKKNAVNTELYIQWKCPPKMRWNKDIFR